MICSCRQLLCAKKRAQRCEELAGELSAVVCYHIHLYPVWEDPIIEEYVSHIGGLVICSVGITHLSLEYRSIMTMTYWFALAVLGRGPEIYLPTNFNGPVSEMVGDDVVL